MRAQTLPELAATWGLPADALAETVETVKRTARGQSTDAFDRADFAAGPLDAPYYSIRVRGALFHTQGGLAASLSVAGVTVRHGERELAHFGAQAAACAARLSADLGWARLPARAAS